MIDLGKVKPGSTIRIPFSSFDKDDGSSITMTNYAAADILIYKDGSTTERASTSGFTATTDFDAKTGKHVAVIDLADNTTAGFYSSGSEYMVAIDAVTVDAVTTGGWIARFVIGMESADLNTTIATLASQTSFTLTVGPAEDDALNGAEMYAHDVASAVQGAYATVLDYTGSTKTVTLAVAPTFTMAATDNVSFWRPTSLTKVLGSLVNALVTGRLDVSVGAMAANVMTAAAAAADLTTELQSGLATQASVNTIDDFLDTEIADIQARLPAALVGGRIDANIGAISSDTTAADNAEAFFDGTGYAGTGNVIPTVTTVTTVTNLTNSPTNGDLTATMKTSVTTAATAATPTISTLGANTITATSIAANALTAAKIATDAIGAAQIAADAVTEIQAGLATPTNITAGTITTAINVTTVNGLAANVITAASLAADAGAEIADAVWDEATAGHSTAGTTGKALTDAGSAGDPWSTALPGAYGAGTAGKILGDNIPQTGDSFARIGVAGAGLTNIDLPNQTMDIVGNITGNLSGSVGSVTGAVGSVTGAVGSVTGNVGGNVTGSVGTVNALAANVITAAATAADFGAEIADAVHDEVVDGSTTFRQSTRLANSANGAKASGMGTTTGILRDLADTKPRITATIDADGNRSAITLDLT